MFLTHNQKCAHWGNCFFLHPELKEYTDEQAEDLLETVIHYMPIVLPVAGALQIFMLAFIAVYMA